MVMVLLLRLDSIHLELHLLAERRKTRASSLLLLRGSCLVLIAR